MNAAQALTRLRKVLGARAAIRDSGRPSSDEQREAARVARVASKQRADDAHAALTAWRDELLQADAEYQRLLQANEAASSEPRKEVSMNASPCDPLDRRESSPPLRLRCIDGEYWTSRSVSDTRRILEAHDELVAVLGAIVRDLPTRRDWLDPAIERAARGLVSP
jgi:hypothetical protein